MEQVAGGGEVGFGDGVAVERDVDGADDVKDGGAGFGGVEVVGERGVVGPALLLDEFLEFCCGLALRCRVCFAL